MTQLEKNKIFKDIVDKMMHMYEEKNELYGDSFNQLLYEMGLIAAVVPLDNKLRRIKSIVKGTEVKYESLEDSLYDLANYAIMTLIHLKEKQKDMMSIATTPVVQSMPYDSDFSLIHTIKNPCDSCIVKISGALPYTVGDSPCQWCRYGTRVTCNDYLVTGATSIVEEK